jgi:hypothetical protein
MCGGLVPLYGSLAEMAVWAGTSWPRPRSKPTGLARAARARSSWSPCPEWSRRPPTIAAMQCGTSSGIGTSGPRGRRLARWWGRKLTGTPTRWRGGGGWGRPAQRCLTVVEKSSCKTEVGRAMWGATLIGRKRPEAGSHRREVAATGKKLQYSGLRWLSGQGWLEEHEDASVNPCGSSVEDGEWQGGLSPVARWSGNAGGRLSTRGRRKKENTMAPCSYRAGGPGWGSRGTQPASMDGAERQGSSTAVAVTWPRHSTRQRNRGADRWATVQGCVADEWARVYLIFNLISKSDPILICSKS